jgi:uncharacterized membrane protein YcjF (UPF0283 family)
VLFAEISVEGWVAIITSTILTIGTVVLQVIREIRGTVQANEAARLALEAKKLLKENTDLTAIRTEAIEKKVEKVADKVDATKMFWPETNQSP